MMRRRTISMLLACVVALLVVYYVFFYYQQARSLHIISRFENMTPEVTARVSQQKKFFTILDWSPAFFSKENGLPVNATVGNCLVTRDRRLLLKSDAVAIEVRGIPYLKDMPQQRLPWQRWVYFNIEPPFYAILDYVGHYKMSDFTGALAFNWSMTYRRDADVTILHGWTVKKSKLEASLTKPPNKIVKNKTKLASAMMSNCNLVKNGRGKYVKELQKHMKVDVYGSCGTLKCGGHYTKKACEKIGAYKFFFAFENSNCRDYISFKMFMQGFGNEAVPVVMGAYKEDYVKLAPPNSFIHVSDFKSPKALAEYLSKLDKDDAAYSAYHMWRREYKIDYEYRFVGDYVWRQLCSTLNKRHNEGARWYDKITDFENPDKDCYQEKWFKQI